MAEGKFSVIIWLPSITEALGVCSMLFIGSWFFKLRVYSFLNFKVFVWMLLPFRTLQLFCISAWCH